MKPWDVRPFELDPRFLLVCSLDLVFDDGADDPGVCVFVVLTDNVVTGVGLVNG